MRPEAPDDPYREVAMLSADDQRRLAGIEEQLLIDDPALARRLARHRKVDVA